MLHIENVCAADAVNQRKHGRAIKPARRPVSA
jgi:hypothetical protein